VNKTKKARPHGAHQRPRSSTLESKQGAPRCASTHKYGSQARSQSAQAWTMHHRTRHPATDRSLLTLTATLSRQPLSLPTAKHTRSYSPSPAALPHRQGARQAGAPVA